MPLADGLTDAAPVDLDWKAKTLAAVIEERRSASSWFNAGNILEFTHPLLDAVQKLSDAGVIHRDIKPENILFVNGRASLGDISLLADDAATITRRGTPGYQDAWRTFFDLYHVPLRLAVESAFRRCNWYQVPEDLLEETIADAMGRRARVRRRVRSLIAGHSLRRPQEKCRRM